ncbi:MAG: N-acetyl-gamma-glutamyl-phosphate reductase [Xanthomonadales bacterium]|jgi:N-acetyl-gamma-glutamyl-phosphate reductase|nr:N-acetyl-gamma-glutamyl-phosphate reductase [Xanthomonadales bacterium]
MKLALIGGRGYTGAELLTGLALHPSLDLAFASSHSQAGTPISAACSAWPGDESFLGLEPGQVAEREADAWVLAVPNGAAAAWAEAIHRTHEGAVILDLSADHRFRSDWTYGLPERNRDALRSARRIANPGCYATGAQLALLPLLDQLDGPPQIFGVSGYSGAGKKPSPNNDPERLRDNLVPYKLAGHVHELEITHQLEHRVRFMPHVAAFFRGISLTVSAQLLEPTRPGLLFERFAAHYAGEPRVRVQEAIPEVRAVQGTPDCLLGGFTVDERDPRCVTLVAVLDNLLKGAASQALQNINLALGLEESLGLEK